MHFKYLSNAFTDLMKKKKRISIGKQPSNLSKTITISAYKLVENMCRHLTFRFSHEPCAVVGKKEKKGSKSEALLMRNKK